MYPSRKRMHSRNTDRKMKMRMHEAVMMNPKTVRLLNFNQQSFKTIKIVPVLKNEKGTVPKTGTPLRLY